MSTLKTIRCLEKQSKFMLYTFNSDVTNINVVLGEDAVWVCQLSLAEISDATNQNISLHLNNIYIKKLN